MNQETIKKLVLGVLLGFGGLYVYFDLLLGPLGKRSAIAENAIVQHTPLIEEAKKEIMRTRVKEQAYQEADTAHQLREILDAKIPSGSSIAWFPERLGAFFGRHSVRGVTYQLVNEEPDANLTGFKTSRWNIMISRIAFQKFGNVLAALENEEGLAQINSLQIDSDLTAIEEQRVRLELSTIVR